MNPPTLAGFIAFIQNVMGISSIYLPTTSPVIQMALTIALDIVNVQLQTASPDIYTLAVYNLAGDNLINFAPDQAGQTYFQDLRTSFHISDFVAGVVQSSGDEGTSTSLTVPEALSHLTLSDLQNLKTPYGRQYLAFAQRYGQLWGLT